MLAYFKKSVAVVATVGALALGGSAVANAADRANIPDVVGMSTVDATAALEDAGFSNITANTAKTDGPVIGTNFPIGVKVSENAHILLILNTH